ncbi:MAG: hypothetical protein BroJett030_05040 [Alphaproteobacteria bacterium]|nr:MAG: hypothetical protein BroJett030_05040 [Alphaproteobacteria bacterium]
MTTEHSQPARAARRVDHLVLPVGALSVARQRLEALGFMVAADARHPFGTENCCVYFADGTYLEPLAIDQRETCEATALRGNVFTARDQAYRFRRGEDGFSAIAFATDDATGDHARFRAGGLSAGRMLRFSRAFAGADGQKARLSFRLAFAADLRAPDVFFLTCERIGSVTADRGALIRHANGVVGLREVAMCEPNPADFQYLLEAVVGTREVNAHSFGIELAAANANIAAYSPAGLKAWFGENAGGHGRGLRLRAVVFAVADLAATRRLFAERGIAFAEIAGRLVVAPAPGQGAAFAFEAA